MIGFKSTDKNKSDRVVHRCWYWGSWMLEKHEVRNKIAGAVLLGIFAIGSLLSGCAAKVAPQPEYVGPGAYEVVDYEGTVVRIPGKPKRVLTLSLTFDVIALGLTPPKTLAAVNFMAADPGLSCIADEVQEITPKLLSYPLETVAALKPDLIIAATWTDQATVQCFRGLGIPVFVCKGPETVGQVRETILLMGEVLREEQAARNVLAIMDAELAETEKVVARQTGRKPVGMLVSQMTSYGGKGSMFDELCTKAGIVNGIAAMGLKNGELITKETVIASNPDFFLISADRKYSTEQGKKMQQEYLNDPALQHLPGIRNIKALPDRHLYSANQNCVYAIRTLANAAYGELFDPTGEKLIKGY